MAGWAVMLAAPGQERNPPRRIKVGNPPLLVINGLQRKEGKAEKAEGATGVLIFPLHLGRGRCVVTFESNAESPCPFYFGGNGEHYLVSLCAGLVGGKQMVGEHNRVKPVVWHGQAEIGWMGAP